LNERENQVKMNVDVAAVLADYPVPIQQKLMQLRQMLLTKAAEVDEVGVVEETLKWGEPSYLTKNGSTIRMAWKKSLPDHYAIYFNCKTKLVDTFKEIYRDQFQFEGNRALVFHMNDDLNFPSHSPAHSLAIEHCMAMALNYHRIKYLPLLGN
jgi:hypothetical protein